MELIVCDICVWSAKQSAQTENVIESKQEKSYSRAVFPFPLKYFTPFTASTSECSLAISCTHPLANGLSPQFRVLLEMPSKPSISRFLERTPSTTSNPSNCGKASLVDIEWNATLQEIRALVPRVVCCVEFFSKLTEQDWKHRHTGDGDSHTSVRKKIVHSLN